MLLYLHIPFCDSKCHYCAFNSYVDKFELKEAYVDALIRQFVYEIEKHHLLPKTFSTLFIGGGTPSTLSPALFERLFHTLRPYLKEDAEITTEANPNSATASWLDGMVSLGVGRLSLGVQSFDEKKLRYLGRNHSPKNAIQALENAQKIGFKHISIDLIYDTPLDTHTLLSADLEIAKNLPIDHLSAYGLSIEDETLFYSRHESPKDDHKMARWFFESLHTSGFCAYEISNFSRGYTSQHNLGYWQYKNYIGLGAGAVGFVDDRRFYPHRTLDAYIQHPHARKEELLSHSAMKLEKIFMGLRSEIGIDVALLNDEEKRRAQMLTEENKLRFLEGRYYNEDYLLSDEIALFLGR